MAMKKSGRDATGINKIVSDAHNKRASGAKSGAETSSIAKQGYKMLMTEKKKLLPSSGVGVKKMGGKK